MNNENNLRDLDNLIIDLQGAELQREWIGADQLNSYRTDFLEKGFRAFDIPAAVNEFVRGFFDEKYKVSFRNDDCDPAYWPNQLTAENVEDANKFHFYFGPPALENQKALAGFFEEISGEIEREMGSPFTVTNMRAVALIPSDDYGPSELWHFDGSARFLRKILVYPQAMNTENGTFEFYDRAGNIHQMRTDGPAAVLVDTSILHHRARSGTNQNKSRFMVEVTIAPAVTKSPITYAFHGQNARIPKVDESTLPPHLRNLYVEKLGMIRSGLFGTPQSKKLSRAKRMASQVRTRIGMIRQKKSKIPATNTAGHINIGGGPSFQHKGWLNFDAVNRSSVGTSFSFHPNMVLPVATRSIQLVYSSHCLEHLDDATVARVLEEARRVIAPNGSLVLKIPDFERVLERYRQNDGQFFQNRWNIEAVTDLWATKGVKDSLAARASFIFAGYWNVSCGDPFEAETILRSGAYHGPAPIATEVHEEILRLADPRKISRELCRHIGEVSDFAGFNHQNAWSRQQFAELVSSHGFEVLHDGDTDIQKKFAEIPGIKEMSKFSQYLFAKPNS